MKTFEEWWERFPVDNRLSGPKKDFESIFKSAREGMIPADRAIEVPDVGEWPEWADCVVLHYGGCNVQVSNIAVIPRPVPTWVPKVGDAVFALDTNQTTVIVAIVKEIKNQHDAIIDYFGRICVHAVSFSGSKIFCKPFDASKIGKPWSEI